MSVITSAHFGGNIIFTRDSLESGSAFDSMVSQVDFHNFRFPGGSITENATWENGQLEKMFGAPLDPADDDYVMTIREALSFASDSGSGLTIVIPTKQFLDRDSGLIKEESFDRYMSELTKALEDFPDAKINAFEIGNEYWGNGPGGSLTPEEYGYLANEMIPELHTLATQVANETKLPGIGIQSGSAFGYERDENGHAQPTGSADSHAIANAIDVDARDLVTHVFQHDYVHADRGLTWQTKWAVDPMKVFENLDGFSDDLYFSMSEFNISPGTAVGVAQGAHWLESFSARVDAGIDEFLHWGLNYEWQSNKFFDTRFPDRESEDGQISAIATPMGQVYDIASNYLIGKNTLTDAAAVSGLRVDEGVNITGFSDDGQKIVFLYNGNENSTTIDFSDVFEGQHVSTYHIVPADSPLTPNYDESLLTPSSNNGPVDARGDMQVISGEAPESFDLGSGEMVAVVVSDQDRDLILEGAHHSTDPQNGMVNDQIFGGAGNDIIRGHVGNDSLVGGGGRNVLIGGQGDDTIVAGDGGDIIFSGDGTDFVTGGQGSDVVIVNGKDASGETVIETGEGSDAILIGSGQNVQIIDFSDDDILGFDGYFADLEEFYAATYVNGEDLYVDLGETGQLRLAGGADRADTLHENVLDFKSEEEIEAFNDRTFTNLNKDQINELYDNIDTMDGIRDLPPDVPVQDVIAHEDGAVPVWESYWEGRVLSLERSDLPEEPEAPNDPEPPEDPEPLPPDDPDTDFPPDEAPEDDYSNGDMSGGACFVATAAYGDKLHPDVRALRAFRDQHLIRYRVGRSFVRFYWFVGPKLARHTKPEQFHAAVVRKILTRFVCGLRWAGMRGI